MGRLYAFECVKCGFRANVSGGEDRGTHCFTRTIVCEPCRKLYEVATHIRWPGSVGDSMKGARHPAGQEAALKALLPAHVGAALVVARRPSRMAGRLLSGSDRSCWVEMKVQCPAFSRHTIRPWNHPGRCPRCGTFLETTVMPFLIWE